MEHGEGVAACRARPVWPRAVNELSVHGALARPAPSGGGATTNDATPDVDANVPPPCPNGLELHGDYATCGDGCTHDGTMPCPPGWYCTCGTSECMWFESFPPDAGGFGGCSGFPDAGISDGAP